VHGAAARPALDHVFFADVLPPPAGAGGVPLPDLEFAMRTASRTLLLSALFVLLAGCGASRGGAAAESTPLRVNNQSWLDMRIYVVSSGSGQRIRLGMVTGNSVQTLRIPSHVVGMGREVSFIADPVGSPTVASSFNIYVRPNQQVSITIPPTVR
jgi:hypothetical protein